VEESLLEKSAVDESLLERSAVDDSLLEKSLVDISELEESPVESAVELSILVAKSDEELDSPVESLELESTDVDDISTVE